MHQDGHRETGEDSQHGHQQLNGSSIGVFTTKLVKVRPALNKECSTKQKTQETRKVGFLCQKSFNE